MKKVALATIIALSLAANSEAGVGDRIREGTNKARSNISGQVNRQRERAESFRDATKSRVQDSADRARSSMSDTKERAETYFHNQIEEGVRRERRRFGENPSEYSLDLGKKINRGVFKFENAASEGIAQGFVDIEYQRDRRLGDLLEDRFGIPEDRTKRGVKLGVLYLMGYNPAYFISELPIVNDSDGSLVTIERAKETPSLRSKAMRLETAIHELAGKYQHGDMSGANRSLARLADELRALQYPENTGMYDKVPEALQKPLEGVIDLYHSVRDYIVDNLGNEERVREMYNSSRRFAAYAANRLVKKLINLRMLISLLIGA